MTDLIVSTFNCEWRPPRSPDAETIRSRLQGSHVVCLTEAPGGFMLGEGFSVCLPEARDERYPDRRKVVLWSARPWSDLSFGIDDLGDYYVAGTTDTPIGHLRVHGVVLPYRFSGVRYGNPKRQTWEQHRRCLEMIDKKLEPAPVRSILMGDFNQRIPRKYQPQKIYEAMESVILARLALASGDTIEPIGRAAIDHICHSHDLRLVGVASLSNYEGGREISDHFGLRAIYKNELQEGSAYFRRLIE